MTFPTDHSNVKACVSQTIQKADPFMEGFGRGFEEGFLGVLSPLRGYGRIKDVTVSQLKNRHAAIRIKIVDVKEQNS